MEIKDTIQIIESTIDTKDSWVLKHSHTKKWVALDDEVEQAIALFKHLKEHKEVKEAPFHRGEPMCKICGLSAKQILGLEKEIKQSRGYSKK